MSGNPIKRHPIVTLGIILFFAVTALVVFRLSSGAKTDPRKNRILTVGTMSPIKQDLDEGGLFGQDSRVERPFGREILEHQGLADAGGASDFFRGRALETFGGE